MPKRTDISSILVIGSGPIIIGQACEFDYSGTQAIKALKREGYKVILVNSNPATIMTDPEFADRTYVEPLTPETVEMIIERERPDALLPTLGGQTSLNIATALHERGVLEKYNVELIGAKFDAIQRAEDRELFKKTMLGIGLELPIGEVVTTVEEAIKAAEEIGFPIIIRPSFTLGGIGGGTSYNVEEFEENIKTALRLSPIHTALIEESIIGWKEFELEVMRDLKDNVVIICSIENVDPMGVHTGDSITVAPAQTLTDREYQNLRDQSIKVIRAIGVETGGSNIQFAVNPNDGRVVVIEMNPRVSRSSALASKATGYPIAKIAALLSVGYTLDELPNDITGTTPASFEPTIDYVVVKIPRWDFEKFPLADASLNTHMKSIGEAMAIGRTFKEALQKGIRSLEIGRFGFMASPNDPDEVKALYDMDTEAAKKIITERVAEPSPTRLLFLRAAFMHGMTIDELYEITGIDPWFLAGFEDIVAMEKDLQIAADENRMLETGLITAAKRNGFSDRQLAMIGNIAEEDVRDFRTEQDIVPVYKMVDTCAAEFASQTPYYFSTYERETEVSLTDKERVLILGGGPNRIGQGIEFDYCCVHSVMAIRELGYETIMVNSNPETVSTDYDTADKLYFEPLTLEDVLHIVQVEKPIGVIMQFGGQTPLRLALPLQKAGVNILGTSPDSIDIAEDRERFSSLLDELEIPYPQGDTATSEEEALEAARKIGFPVLVRPSYVLGGRAMQIVYNETDLRTYMLQAVQASPDHPVLIDKFLEDAYEFDVDAISDGERTIIGGIMQHIEEAGIHSGDSACVLPPYALTDEERETIRQYTYKIADALNVRGLMNIQYALKNGVMQILEVNPRASRTVPFVSKAKGIPLAKVAARVMMGVTLEQQGFTEEIVSPHVSVKESVFPFDKFSEVISYLGPEMRSTGEVMGIWEDFGLAFWKSQESVGVALPLSGTVFVSINDNDKPRLLPIAKDLAVLGFKLMATYGTADYLKEQGLEVERVKKVLQGRPHIVDRIIDGDVQLVINTPLGPEARQDEYVIAQTAISRKVPIITTLSGAHASVRGIRAMMNQANGVKSLQEYHTTVPGLDSYKNAEKNLQKAD
jgi:carbamoyl-phosphate synthase large subunit